MSTRGRLRSGRPIWLRDTPIERQYPRLAGPHEADVVVVGGGMTGALVAQAFAEAKVAVSVVEGALVGSGSTAASSALLLQEPDLGLIELDQLYGHKTSRRLWRLSHDAVGQMVALLKRLRISCHLRHRDADDATHSSALERLHDEFERRTRSGFSGEWLGPGRLRRLTGISGRGAIQTTGSAQCDPYQARLGLLRAAGRSGAQVFERSPVTRIDGRRDRVRVRTRTGTIEAKRVVIATGYATPFFRPLAGRFRLYRTYALATKPMTAAERHELGLSDVMVWDTERPYHYARWTPDHRLLLGGADRPLRPGQRRDAQFTRASGELREYFESQWPALAACPTAAGWEGLFAMTPDSLPYIGSHRRYPGHWFALGYGGNGMTFGFLAARLLLEQWQETGASDIRLLAFDR